MKSNKMRFGLLLLVSLLTINVASANPGFTVAVTPISSTVSPGGTATYSVTLTAMDTLDTQEFAKLSVIDLEGNPISWTTTFSENSFLIGPYPSEKTITLAVDIPPETLVGQYNLKVLGDGYFPDDSDPTTPDTSWTVESSDFPLTVSVTQIPEFPTIAVPLISALGIVFLVSRRKEGSS